MANWISSKLKAAENILHQIDQQAAESLRKNEKLRSDELGIHDAPAAKSGSVVSLKNQLKKKPSENNDYHGKLHSDPNFTTAPKSSPTPTLADADWTQLLSSPTHSIASASGGDHGNGARGFNKNGRKHKDLLLSDVKRNHKTGTSGSRSLQRLNSVKLTRKTSDDGMGFTSERHSTDGKPLVEKNDKANQQHQHTFNYRDISPPESLQEDNKTLPMPVSDLDNAKIAPDVVPGQLRGAMKARHGLNSLSGNSKSDDFKRGSSISDGSSESDTDSGSSYDSESEHEREERRKKRERVLAEKAAAIAINAIREKENMVAKLEGEKQSLEKILEERAYQQAQEVMS